MSEHLPWLYYAWRVVRFELPLFFEPLEPLQHLSICSKYMQNNLNLTIICYFLDRDLMRSHNLVSIPITKTLDPAMLWVFALLIYMTTTNKLSNVSLKVLSSNIISKNNMADHWNNFTKRLKTTIHFTSIIVLDSYTSTQSYI